MPSDRPVPKIGHAANVSFIMPAYNCQGMVEASIRSIVAGNAGSADELVVVDDGSTDATISVLGQLQRELPFIRVVRHDRNRGAAAARNTAINNASHRLLFALDSDNLLSPGSVPRLVAHLNEQDADAAAFRELWYFKGAPPRVTHRWVFRETVALADCFAGGVVPPSSGNYLFTRSSWDKAGGYPEEQGLQETWGFGVRQLATGTRMVTLSGSHYLHRYGHESYFVRLAREGTLSVAATRCVTPFLDRFTDESRRAITEEPGCRNWFESLNQRPLALKEGLGRPGRVDTPFPRRWSRFFMRRALRGLA